MTLNKETLNRRNFIFNSLLWLLALFFGFKIGESDTTIVIDKNGKLVSDKIDILKRETEKSKILMSGYLNILEFEHLVIDKGYKTEDWKHALKAAEVYLRNSSSLKKLVFPTGVYPYSISPNWSITDLEIESIGEVRLRYTGLGNAVVIDGEEGSVWNLDFRGFLIECPSTAKNALFVRNTHGSKIDAKVLGAGKDYAGLKVEWCVCSEFKVIVSVNHEGWYLNSRPKYGYYLDKTELQSNLQGGYTSWCTFNNPIIEGCHIGIYIDGGQGNSFYSGTSEGNLDIGMYLTRNAIYNKFFSIDMEANKNNDIHCEGNENEFYSVDNMNEIVFSSTAHDNLVIGGSHVGFYFSEQTYGNILQNVKYNRFGDGAVIQDLSGKNRLVNNRNVGTKMSENRPAAVSRIAIVDSPFVYVNESGNDEQIGIVGGEVSSFQFVRSNYGDEIPDPPPFVRLCPGDSIKLKFGVAPKVVRYTT